MSNIAGFKTLTDNCQAMLNYFPRPFIMCNLHFRMHYRVITIRADCNQRTQSQHAHVGTIPHLTNWIISIFPQNILTELLIVKLISSSFQRLANLYNVVDTLIDETDFWDKSF